MGPLQLYMKILRLHRQKLPYDLRAMGDSYVKKEFRDHRNAKPEFVSSFLLEWGKYAESMEIGQYANSLDETTVSEMSDEQRASLGMLRREATDYKPL